MKKECFGILVLNTKGEYSEKQVENFIKTLKN